MRWDEPWRRFRNAATTAIPLPVSHAFHTDIVAPASVPLRAMLQRLGLRPPKLPIVANVTGELYPAGEAVEQEMLDILARQVASPVQFMKGLHTLYDEGARIFVEVGPKHALQGFASDVLGDDAIVSLATNHPKQGDVATFNNALCGLWAAGVGAGREPVARAAAELKAGATIRRGAAAAAQSPAQPSATDRVAAHPDADLERLVRRVPGTRPQADRQRRPGRPAPTIEPVVITGAALGLPGAERLFDDANIARLLDGEQGIDLIPGALRREMLDKHITRLVKGEDGGASFETIDRLDEVIKLAARAGAFDLGEEFGVDADRLRRAWPQHAAGDRRRHRRAARRRDSPRAPLQDHDHGHPASRPLVAARRAARRHRSDLRLRVPRARGDGRRGRRATPPTTCAGSGWRRWSHCARGCSTTTAPTRWFSPRWSAASTTSGTSSNRSRTRSIAGFCSGCCRWATRSSPS